MAVKGQVESILNALDPDVKKVLVPVFRYVLDNLRFGDDARAENFQLYKFSSTTASVANTEFSIRHGLNQIPSKVLPYLDLNQVGSQMVPLQVSRAPDANRVYLKSTSTSAVFNVWLEV